MMHTLIFRKCRWLSMSPCVETCTWYDLPSSCFSLMINELTYYDANFLTIALRGHIVEKMDPAIIRADFDKGLSEQKEKSLIGEVKLFLSRG